MRQLLRRRRLRCNVIGFRSKKQFSNSPDLSQALTNAIIDALAAHTTMSKQALDSEIVRAGLKDVLLGPGQLYETLRARGSDSQPIPP